MFKDIHSQYCVKTCPITETQELEDLLNSMSQEGWELYNLIEAESSKGGFQYNCIFARETIDENETDETHLTDVAEFKSKMERMLHQGSEPYQECEELQKKISAKKEQISKIKNQIDSENSDSREELNKQMSENIEELNTLRKELSEIISPDKMLDKITEEKLMIMLSDELLDLVSSKNNAPLITEIVKTRQELTEKLGYILPSIKLKDAQELEANEYAIKIRGVESAKACVYPGYRMFYEEYSKIPEDLEEKIEDVDYKNQKVIWVKEELTKDYWDRGLSANEVITKNLKEISVKNVEEILDYNDINKYVDIVGDENIVLIENIFPDVLTVGEMRYILTSLIREKVSVKDIVYIFEKINDNANEADIDDMIESIRISLSRQINSSLADEQNNIYLIKLTKNSYKAFEKKFLDVDYLKFFKEKSKRKIDKLLEENNFCLENTALIAPISIRKKIFDTLSGLDYHINVLCNEELSNDYNIVTIGEINI